MGSHCSPLSALAGKDSQQVWNGLGGGADTNVGVESGRCELGIDLGDKLLDGTCGESNLRAERAAARV